MVAVYCLGAHKTNKRITGNCLFSNLSLIAIASVESIVDIAEWGYNGVCSADNNTRFSDEEISSRMIVARNFNLNILNYNNEWVQYEK